MAITKKERKQLEAIRYDLKRAVKYLLDDKEVVGLARPTQWPNGGSYTVINPKCSEEAHYPASVDVMNKHIGSDITGVYMALEKIERFLNPPTLTESTEDY